MSNNLSHKDLCDIAVRWLKRHGNGIGCNFAVSEIQTGITRSEQADAFGYRCTGERMGSWLVEAKTSRSDFLADAKKPHRIDPSLGVGQYRVYICPEDVIKVDELPVGWGLIYVNSRKHVKPIVLDDLEPFHERNQEGEQYLMARLISRFDDVEKFNLMLKESSAMASRAWARVERAEKQLKETNQKIRDDDSYIHSLLKRIKEANQTIADHEYYIHHLLERLEGKQEETKCANYR